jgi:hypothetical protein
MLPLPDARMSDLKKTLPTMSPKGIEPTRNETTPISRAAPNTEAEALSIGLVARTRLEIEGQRHAFEVELLTQRVLDEALVGVGDQIRIVAVEEETRRLVATCAA